MDFPIQNRVTKKETYPMRTLLIVASIAATCIASSAFAQGVDIIIPERPVETVSLTSVIRTPVTSVRFIIPKDDSTIIAEGIPVPGQSGVFVNKLNGVPCGTEVRFRAVADTEDGRTIRSDWSSLNTAACPVSATFAANNPARPQMENDYTWLKN
jgi:hypothetical protein